MTEAMQAILIGVVCGLGVSFATLAVLLLWVKKHD